MKNVWAYLLVLLIVVPPFVIAEFYGCSVSGLEFSPDDFTARSFSYRRSPLSQTLRSKRINQDHELYCTAMIDDGHITAITSTPKRWDLYEENMQHTDRLSGEFDARFLTHFLDYNAQQWTTSCPKKAALLWPEIAKMARNGLYLYIPEIMTTAIPKEYTDEENRTLETFFEQTKSEFANAYRLAARVAKANGNAKKSSQWSTAAARWENRIFNAQYVEAEESNQSTP